MVAQREVYLCLNCGNIAEIDYAGGANLVCCGQPMEEIVPGTTDAAAEKHVPVFEVKGDVVEVCVGSVEHPMLDAHYIEWIILETNQGFQKKDLKPGQAPVAVFALAEGETPIAAYESCNLHGIWKADI